MSPTLPSQLRDAPPRHASLWREVAKRCDANDLAHDAEHVLRVYAWAIKLAPEAEANVDLAGAAALVHDLINVPKESEARREASERSARASLPLLDEAGYASAEVDAIVDAVITCSWSKGLAPRSALGRVLQDADRLDAIGALGIARTLITSGAMAARGKLELSFYDPADPLAEARQADDRRYSLDHFAVKLLRLATGMHLPSAQKEAARRQERMREFLEQLKQEIGAGCSSSDRD